tara:strand:+ start:1448 stop:3091 length:1644 start_codon:yes stop_codon:yes gene_type:complete
MNSNFFDKKKQKILHLFKEKKYVDVIKIGKSLLKIKSNDKQVIYLLGLSSIYCKNLLEAKKYFENLLILKKTHEIYYTYGNILKNLEKYSEAAISFEKAIDLNPNFSEAYNNLGNTRKFLDEPDKAIECFKRAIKLKENNLEALFNLARIYQENNKFEDLILVYKKLLNFDKNHIKTLYNLGSAHLFLGNITEGKKYFEKVLELDEYNVPSFRNYVNITKIDKDNKLFKQFLNVNFDELNDQDKILIFDALSKCYFDQDNNELGFNFLTKSNFIKKEKTKFSLVSQKDKYENIKDFFSDKANLNLKFNDQIKSKPLFILGMPRSGTSLLEQILSTHSKIHGAGELNYIEKIINQLGLKKKNDLKNYFTEIRDYYYKNLKRISNKAYIIDKTPLNCRWIGFIINAFPEAKIIHIERNPMAVCWSNYKTLFVDSGLDFSLSQEDMAKYYVMYNDLMSFWVKKFKSQIINIQYEDFVQNFEVQTKNILLEINLNWEDDLRNYEKTNRAVRTASFQQVRGKIKKNTSKQWEKYSDYLKPMQKILKNNQIKF